MGMTPVTPEFLAVARGEAPADLLLANARVINVFTCEIIPASVAVSAGRIAAVLGPEECPAAARVIDLKGAVLSPGFIDAHMHVESSMLPPSEFASLAVPHGTTGAVLDPHEIANVLGVEGIRAIMRDAAESGDERGPTMNFLFALSSCVPSCHLETSGAKIEARDLEPFFDDERVVALAEMMNFPGAAMGVPAVLEKINLGLSRGVVDGHAPGLSGRLLQAYAAARISSDHECATIGEAREKLRLGMRIFIREGSAARNLEALLPLVTPASRTRFCFCTDDRHPDDLLREGHIDHVIRRAVSMGMELATAAAIGSFHTARHYGLGWRGAIAPGYHADLVVLDEPRTPRVRSVYFEGRHVAENGELVVKPRRSSSERAAVFPRSGVRLPAGFGANSLRVASTRADPLRIRVIGMNPHQLVTDHLVMRAKLEDGAVVSDVERDVLKIAVVERHRGGGNIGIGFVRGFGLRRGALASTVGHDAHNLTIVGTNDPDMALAARTLAEVGGGQCAVMDGRVLAVLALPIAGLMGDQGAEAVIERQRALLAASRELGCPHSDPFMPLSFMPLPVIPKLKISDVGLVDVERFEVVGLVVGEE